jgi:hypothetical protein
MARRIKLNQVSPESLSNPSVDSQDIMLNQSGVVGTKNSDGDFIPFGGGVEPYKKYIALMTQSGTASPSVVILENTIGDIVWTRTNNGVYMGYLLNAFPENKTFFPGVQNTFSGGSPINVAIYRNFEDHSVFIQSGNTGIGDDDNLLSSTSIEIRVYP